MPSRWDATSLAFFSSRRCWEMAGWEMSKAAVSSFTERSEAARRERIPLRAECATALNIASLSFISYRLWRIHKTMLMSKENVAASRYEGGMCNGAAAVDL